MIDPTKIRMAQTMGEASIALEFTRAAIAILAIPHEFPRKVEVQDAAAAHLLMVFNRPDAMGGEVTA